MVQRGTFFEPAAVPCRARPGNLRRPSAGHGDGSHSRFSGGAKGSGMERVAHSRELSAPGRGRSACHVGLRPATDRRRDAPHAAARGLRHWLADDNSSRAAIVPLREAGQRMQAISEIRPGGPDEKVIGIARESGRMLPLFDRVHGDQVFSWPVWRPLAGGVVLRPETLLPHALNALLVAVAERGEAVLRWRFAVVTPRCMRQRALPAPR